MRILQLMKTSTGGIWGLRQMSELIKLGIEVHVAMPAGGTLVNKYIEAGIKVHFMNFSLKHYFKTANRLKEIIAEVKPDLIHSHFIVSTVIMRLSLRCNPTPRLFQVPGPLHLENWFFRNAEIMLSQKQDYWCGSCKWTNDRYRKSGISDQRIFLSYYGTDVQLNNDYVKGKLKKEMLGLKDSDILVGNVAYMYAPKRYLGQARGLKGHEDLIDAIALLKDKYPNLYCVIIGGAYNNAFAYENKVRKYADIKAKGRVLFTGTINNVSELYNDLFCAIHPSHSENLGGAAESLIFGIPTISTNIGGFPDIVIDKVTGLLVPSKNPRALANALESYLEHKYDIQEMALEGQKRTLEIMEVKNSVQTIYQAYKKILNV